MSSASTILMISSRSLSSDEVTQHGLSPRRILLTRSSIRGLMDSVVVVGVPTTVVDSCCRKLSDVVVVAVVDKVMPTSVRSALE